MTLIHLLSAGALLLSFAYCQTISNTTSANSSAISGGYVGALRPQVHYSPPVGFMNDPNGMFYDKTTGIYHLYYQYNPTGLVAGNVHWGHATSDDLYHWKNQAIALSPSAAGEQIYSGSAIVDTNNTSGFFPSQTNGVVAFYTLLNPSGEQTQDIAYSIDGGYTFTKYAKNPVISVGSSQFRDPKVIWHEDTGRWAMVVAFSQDFVISIYTSPNLVDWTHASNFSHQGLLGLQYECPNLVEIPVRPAPSDSSSSIESSSPETMYLLWISINPGAPLGGSTLEYFPGTFNGTHFVAVDGATRLGDIAKDNYAAQFFFGIPSEQNQVSITWASNWQYCNFVPTGSEGWRSVMGAPRYNYLTKLERIGWSLISAPFDLEPIIEHQVASNNSLGNGTILVDYSNVQSGSLYFQVNITGLPLSTVTTLAGSVNVTFTSSLTGESIRGGSYLGADTWLSRQYVRGFDNIYFTDKFSGAAIYGGGGNWSFSGVIDRTILEVFVNSGEQSGTMIFYPTAPLDMMSLSVAGVDAHASISARVWSLTSTWQ